MRRKHAPRTAGLLVLGLQLLLAGVTIAAVCAARTGDAAADRSLAREDGSQDAGSTIPAMRETAARPDSQWRRVEGGWVWAVWLDNRDREPAVAAWVLVTLQALLVTMGVVTLWPEAETHAEQSIHRLSDRLEMIRRAAC